MLWILYNLLFPIVFLFMLPKFLIRMLRRGGYGSHFEQRLGHFGHNTKARLREHTRIWIHAVSVGEISVAFRFMEAYRKRYPETFFALSTTTSTGHAIARKNLDERDVLFYFPVDFPPIVKKVLGIINPSLLVLVEGELWPNLIRQADQRGIPVALINGRMSERSFRGYRKLRSLMADMLRRVRPICVQSAEDAERMKQLGAPPSQVHCVGTLKFDVAQRNPEGERTACDLLHQLGVPDDAIVLLGGSTWPGEEELLCSMYKRLRAKYTNLFLILVPRHVERKEEIMQTLREQNLSFVRRTQISEASSLPDVLFVDTTGELNHFYAVADIVFIGKSLTTHGGQNPIEPAMHGKAVVFGPYMENFPSVVPLFLDANAVIQVKDSSDLEMILEHLIKNPAERMELGDRAKQVVENNRGTLLRTVELVATRLQSD